MKAVLMRENGGPDVLRLEEVETPKPGLGEARVRLEYAGVNFIDIYGRKGLYKGQLPRILGDEGAGVVDAVGSGVTEVKVGDRVAWAMQSGSYAEYAVIRSAYLVQVPAAIRDAARRRGHAAGHDCPLSGGQRVPAQRRAHGAGPCRRGRNREAPYPDRAPARRARHWDSFH